MSFGEYEFPHTGFYNSDLRELISMYRKLIKEYDSIKQEIDEAIDFINNFHYIIDQEIDDKFAIEFGKLKKSIDSLIGYIDVENNRLKQLIDNNANNIDILFRSQDDLATDLAHQTVRLSRLYTELQDEINKCYQYCLDSREELLAMCADCKVEMKAYIEEVCTQMDRLFVTNPLNGKFENIQKVLNDFAEIVGSLSLTAEEYDSLQLTATQYDVKSLTAFEYDFRAIFTFWFDLYYTMRNPWTGQIGKVSDVLESIIHSLRRTYSAEDFDALDLTAEEFDQLDMTAYYYDFMWAGADTIEGLKEVLNEQLQNLVQISDTGTGLTVEEYSKLKSFSIDLQ